jgi:hypothetical protein
MSDDEYIDAIVVEEDIVVPLDQALNGLYDAEVGFDGHRVDTEQQRAYIRYQIDNIEYVLMKIRDKLEG